MGDRNQQVDYIGFPGGLCSINNGESCLPIQLKQARNVVVAEDGIIRKRPAISQADSNYLADFIIDTFPPYVSCHDKKIYAVSAIHTYTNGGLGQFAYMDRYLHTNGRDPMIQISGVTASVCLGAPLSRIIHRHNDRCFMADGAVLYETVVDTYPSSSVDNFADGASWTIGDSGQSIIGVASIGRNLIIFKQREIYIQVGYTKSERQTYRLTDDYGCLSPDSIKGANLTGLGECVIFLSESAKLCAVTLNGVVEIGECVQDILDTIYLGNPVNEKSVSNYLHRARAVVHPEGYYILAFATTSDDTHDAFDQALCVSLNHPYRSQFGQLWPITLWKKTGATGTSSQTFNGLSYVDINNAYGMFTYCAMTTDSGYTFGLVSSDFDNHPIVLPNSGGRDGYADRRAVGTPYEYFWIDFLIQTRNEDVGTKRIFKQWIELLIRIIQDKPETGLAFFPIKVTQEVDFNLTIDSPPTVYQETLVSGNQPAKYLVEISHGLTDDGVQTNIILENYDTVADGDIKIHGISILWLRSNAK